ncbi:Ankyrin repeat-containing domain protein [Rutstroemia sp. NJR-2017a BBW]|nr:Ankyrin repeat-containing domain protein [Rutstroemia sp. NJR-2017a BBW]
MSFGFSVGDFLAVATLIKEVVVSLKDVGGAAADYQQLIVELHGLQRALDSIEDLRVDAGTRQAENINNLKVTALGCRYVLEEALKKLRSYESLRLGQRSSSLVAVSSKKIKWQIMMKEDVDALRTRLNSHTNYLNMRLSTEILRGASAATARADKSLGDVTQKLEETRLDVQGIRSDLEDNRMGEILDWVSPLRMYDKQQDIFSRHQENTGGWLLETPEFVRARMQYSGVQGITAGAGKTVMSSMVVNHIRMNFQSHNVGVAFFYCDYKQSPTGFHILSSVARQLAEKRPGLEILPELYKEHNNGSSKLLFEELRTILLALCGVYDQVYIIVDALDECPLAEERTLVLDTVRRIPQLSVRTLITSRPNFEDINSALVADAQIEIVARDVDIKSYLGHRIRGNPVFWKRIAKDGLEEQIIDEITNRASGIICYAQDCLIILTIQSSRYLMAVLQIERILTERTPSKIRKALQTLPSKLEANYQDTLERIRKQPEPDNEYGIRILQWVSASQQPLSVKQLSLALSIEWNDDEEPPHSIDPENKLDPDSIVDVCGGLVIIEPASQEVRLVHFTVQEYFSRNPSVLHDAHHEIFKTCLLYLSLDDVGKQLEDSFRVWKDADKISPIPNPGLSRLRSRRIYRQMLMELQENLPLLKYAACFYLSHAPKSSLRPSLAKLFTLFFKSPRMVIAYYIAHDALKLHFNTKPDSKLTGLHVLATLGTPALVSLYLEIYPDVDLVSGTGRTPLYFATAAEQLPMMSYLISNGADVNTQDIKCMMPLFLASKNGFIGGVELLLANGADFNMDTGNDFGSYTALHFAAERGSEHIVKLLVEKGADIEWKTNPGYTPLLEAVTNCHVGVVKILLQAGARADVKDFDWEWVLWWARSATSGLGTEDIKKNEMSDEGDAMIQLLLEAGASIYEEQN